MKCAALAGNTGPNDPQECDAPFCGCNEAWSECMDMLQECGLLQSWEPIDTAPHGTDVLVWLCGNREEQFNNRAMVCRYVGRHQGWCFPGIGGLNASHWMTLPRIPITAVNPDSKED